MRSLKSLLIFIFILGIASCKDEPPIEIAVDNSVSTFYFVRHAEKDRSDMDNRDPELTQDGLGRAMHWAEIFEAIELDAIYSTDYERTLMTAAPIAVKKNLTVKIYDFESLDITQFKAENKNKKVLIVGHSNTTPAFVNKVLNSEKHHQLDDDQNGSLFIVQLVNGVATDMQLNFNCNCPD